MAEYVFGRNPVEELLSNPSRQVKQVYYDPSSNLETIHDLLAPAYERGIPVEERETARLNQMIDGRRHQGIIAVVASTGVVSLGRLMQDLPDKTARILVIDRVQDPVNIGKLLRSALYFGFDGVIKTTDHTAPISDTVASTSAGASTRIPIAEVTNLRRALDRLHDDRFWLAGAVLDAKIKPDELPVDRNLAVVVGNEDSGIRRLTRECCDYEVTIPGPGDFDSLNVAMAGTILMYELQGC